MSSAFETLLAQESAMASPVYDKSGVLYVTSPETGEIIKIDISGDAGNIRASPSTFGFTDGFPLGIVFDSTGALFCVDCSHKALLSRPTDEKVFRILASSCENRPFLGPNALACDSAGNVFFLDGGADGETGIDRPRGSLYQVSIATMALRPILNQCLALPSALAVSKDGSVLYVAEAALNRVLRLLRRPDGAYVSTVFVQLAGGVGPSALALDDHGRLYVCCSEMPGVDGSQVRGAVLPLLPRSFCLTHVTPGHPFHFRQARQISC
jgi:sugar lactone lactonase YvrE